MYQQIKFAPDSLRKCVYQFIYFKWLSCKCVQGLLSVDERQECLKEMIELSFQKTAVLSFFIMLFRRISI